MDSVGTGTQFAQIGDAVSRAAHFRMEAQMLRERACATSEPLIQKRYLELAECWAAYAAGLETALLTQLYSES